MLKGSSGATSLQSEAKGQQLAAHLGSKARTGMGSPTASLVAVLMGEGRRGKKTVLSAQRRTEGPDPKAVVHAETVSRRAKKALSDRSHQLAQDEAVRGCRSSPTVAASSRPNGGSR